MIKKLLKCFLNLFKKKQPVHDLPDAEASGNIIAEPIYSYVYSEDVPDTIDEGILYLIGTDNYYWQAIMKCPCGCNNNLHMNMIEDYDPYWTYKISSENKISLSPSVDRMIGCKSHFFLRNGKIIWAMSHN